MKLIQDTTRLFALSWRKNRRLMRAAIFVVALTSLAPFVQSYGLGQLLNALVSQKWQTVWLFTLVLLSAALIFSLANTIQFYIKTVLYKELFQFLTVLIHKKIAELEIATHEDPKKKDLITKVQDNAMWRAPDYMQRMIFVAQNFLEVLVATVVMFSVDAKLGVLVVLTGLPRFIFDVRYNSELWQVETEVAELRRKFWYARYYLVELKALLEVKLFQCVDFFVGLLDSHLGTVKDREVAVERRNLRGQLLSVVLSEAAAVYIVIALIAMVRQNQLNVGSLAFYLGTLATLRSALNSLSQNVGSQLRDVKFVRDMFEVFDQKAETFDGNMRPLASIDELEFRAVNFAYPGTEKHILKNINFKLRKGQTLGIVAENGSGKSTLAKLLCRIYEPLSGQILVNGRDIREFALDEWRSTIGVMLQEYSHYEHLDIATAIRLGRVNNGKLSDEIVAAAKRGDAHQFIAELPAKYDTTLGRAFVGGAELSGGQYQKLAISRLFYRNPGIAIFDEPTSAIDGEAEARIFEEILRGFPHCTKLLISHRYYTLRKADLICVLDGGEVAELGSHAELMRRDGIYATRYRAQASEYV